MWHTLCNVCILNNVLYWYAGHVVLEWRRLEIKHLRTICLAHGCLGHSSKVFPFGETIFLSISPCMHGKLNPRYHEGWDLKKYREDNDAICHLWVSQYILGTTLSTWFYLIIITNLQGRYYFYPILTNTDKKILLNKSLKCKRRLF